MDTELRQRKGDANGTNGAAPTSGKSSSMAKNASSKLGASTLADTHSRSSSEESTSSQRSLSAAEMEKLKESEEVAYGKTPNGTIFKVPETKDMLSEIFDMSKKKSAFDIVTLAVMGFQIFLFFTLPTTFKRFLFLFLFLFWRAGYNAGLGYLLKLQSERRGLVAFARDHGLFEKEKGSPWYDWLKVEMSCKMGPDYDFETAPIEFNTWLLYRQLVDLILMNDFTTYLCFALSWITFPEGAGFFSHLLRWIGGMVLVVFNIWVKLDAHRVVKDFAWYWGDFFFLIEQSLTFDGVFEMAPHPMYSVGYAGYYGISLMMASYMVLFVSLFAHAAQFAFLTIVENPHIDKTYNPPPAPKKRQSAVINPDDVVMSSASSIRSDSTEHVLSSDSPNLVPCGSKDMYNTYFRRDLIVFKNFDPFRSNDIFVALIIFYATVIPLLISSAGPTVQALFLIFQALAWRVFHSYVLGAVLSQQSVNKFYTKHFIKHGGTVHDAFQSWKSIFNLSNSMTYATFFLAAFRMYSIPEDWTYGTVLLRHVLGLALIALHIWASVSVFEVLGDFGWFYGDFFIDDYSNGLFYTGIYRFVNNPEKVMGHAAFWGMTLICNSWSIFILAMFSQISNFLFLQYVESPHMRKIYGTKIRKDAGVVKTVKAAKILPKNLKDEVSKIRDRLEETPEIKDVLKRTRVVSGKAQDFVDITRGDLNGLVQSVAPKIQEMVTHSKQILENSRDKLLVARTWDDMGDYDMSQYSVKVTNVPQVNKSAEGHPVYQLGEKLEITWTAPLNHGAKDWIGIYKVASSSSKNVTNVASKGRYLYIGKDLGLGEAEEGVDNHAGKGDGQVFEQEVVKISGRDVNQGKVVFEGDKLPWFQGTFELRYHHHERYNVMASTAPFVIALENHQHVAGVAAESVIEVANTLLTFTQRCFDSNEEIMPCSVDEEFLVMKESIATRIVTGIQLLYGIEFAWEVVSVDMSCLRLAHRIDAARRALAPFSVPAVEVEAAAVEL